MAKTVIIDICQRQGVPNPDAVERQLTEAGVTDSDLHLMEAKGLSLVNFLDLLAERGPQVVDLIRRILGFIQTPSPEDPGAAPRRKA